MKFFIPDLRDDPGAAEERWQRYLRDSPAHPNSKRVYSLEYDHGGDKYEVVVGKPRAVYKRKTGPRGGYIKDAGHLGWSVETGTMVSAIIDAGDVIYVWSYGPPFGGWANPSLVGRSEVTSIEYFENKSQAPGGR